MTLRPPPLTNDCFAMPRGAHWTPVDQALTHLRDNLRVITPIIDCPVGVAAGLILAEPAIALRSHPPTPNSAVDGYGFAHASITPGPQILPLVDGRSAAGVPYVGHVPLGHAIRILTGAVLPDGVDTVILQEDVNTDGSTLAFHGDLKPGANCRSAGEDMLAGDTILPMGRRLTPADLGTLSAAGIANVQVRQRLRVGILSTGDELRNPGDPAGPGQIYDANRPMLTALMSQWGYDAVDLGLAADTNDAVTQALDRGAEQVDIILTSGGASAGDEDHVSRLLAQTGSMALWRVAIKPGRPLALGLWRDVPVFGLPGNPVAAYVCALIFASPALSLLAGAGWRDPIRLQIPAAFAKSKKPGRREYLRARLRDGQVEIFPSEGSGRVSGLSWSDGLVELEDPAQSIAPGDLVTYLPYWGMHS